MTSIQITKINSSGKKTGQVIINTPYKNLNYNPDMLSQVVNSYLTNAKKITSHTKTRSEVSGTGKKPYKQKGTGYARFGSLRTPIHRGGGIAFGPRKIKNNFKKIPKKIKKKTLAILLDQKSKDKEIINIPEIKVKQPKTKEALKSIFKLPLKDGNIIILTQNNNKSLYLSLRNIPYMNVKCVESLSLLDLVLYNNIIFVGNSYKNIFQTKNIKKEKIKK